MRTALLATTLLCAAGAAPAQVLTMSTTNPGGLAHSIGSAVARVVTDTTPLTMVVVPSGGSPMPAVAGGEADCGINIAFDVAYYIQGTAFYAGEGPHPNLRMVAAVLPSQITMYVRGGSTARTVADLRGQRVPGGLSAQLSIGAIYEAYLAMGGLTRDDVITIPAQTIVQAADDLAAGRNDAFLFSIGTAKVLEVDSAVGGLRALSVEDTPENRAILSASLPGATIQTLEPGTAPQIQAPTNVVVYDLVIFCADSVPDAVVGQIVRAVHDNPGLLAESFAGMRRFVPANMAPDVPGAPYHPGALAAFAALGVATP